MPTSGQVHSVCCGCESRADFTAKRRGRVLSPHPVEILAIAAEAVAAFSRPSVGPRNLLRDGAGTVVVMRTIRNRLRRFLDPVERRYGRHGRSPSSGGEVVPRKQRQELWACAGFGGLLGESAQSRTNIKAERNQRIFNRRLYSPVVLSRMSGRVGLARWRVSAA